MICTRIKSLLIAVALLTGLVASAAVTDAEVRYGTLPNGLTYYIRHSERPAGFADFFIAERVGSICEDENQRGLAHFLEHMCFNGTEHFPGNSLITYLESIGVRFGAHLNAYTSTDETVYNISSVPVARTTTVDSCLMILRDWACAITLDPEEIDAERGVIVGEWRQRNTAANRILDAVAPEIYPGSRYGSRMPIGLMDVVKTFPYDRLSDFYHRWYGPTNQAVIIVGDVDVASVESALQRTFADVTPGGEPMSAELMSVPANDHLIVSAHNDPEQTTTMVQMHFKHASLPLDNDTAYIRTHLVYDLLSDLLVGRFDVMEESADCPHSRLVLGDTKYLLSRGQRTFMLRGFPKQGRALDAVTMWRAELLRAVRDGFSADEFARSLENVTRSLDEDLAGDARVTNTQRARMYVRHYLDGGPLMSAADETALSKSLLSGITADEVAATLRALVGNDEGRDAVVIAYEPSVEGVAPMTGADLQAAFDKASDVVKTMPAFEIAAVPDNILSNEPEPGSITSTEPYGHYDATLYTLSNGVRVIARRSDAVKGQIYVRAIAPGGISQVYTPEEVPTLKVLNEIVANAGCGNFSSSDIRRWSNGRTIGVSLSLNIDEATVEIATSPEDLVDAFRLMYLKLTDLRPDEAAISTFLSSERERLTNISVNPKQVMGDSIHNIAYSGHPMALKLTPAMLDAASPERALSIARDRFSSIAGFTFYVAGDFDPDSLAYCLEHYVASLPALCNKWQPRDIGYGYPRKARTNEFRRAMVTPSSVVYTIFTNDCPYTVSNLVNSAAYGSILKSRLLADLRETRGWTYSIMSHCVVNAHPGGTSGPMLMLPVNVSVAPEHADETVAIVAETAAAIGRDGVTAEELKRVREQLAASVEAGLSSNAFWLSAMRAYDRDGVDMQGDYLNAVNALSSESISAFGRDYVDTAARSVLVMLPE